MMAKLKKSMSEPIFSVSSFSMLPMALTAFLTRCYIHFVLVLVCLSARVFHMVVVAAVAVVIGWFPNTLMAQICAHRIPDSTEFHRILGVGGSLLPLPQILILESFKNLADRKPLDFTRIPCYVLVQKKQLTNQTYPNDHGRWYFCGQHPIWR